MFLILVGIFILAGKSTLFCPGLEGCGRSCVGRERERGTGELEPPLLIATVVNLHTALLTMETMEE